MKIIGGLGALLLLCCAAGWIADHITGGMIFALIAVAWCAFLGWMWKGYRMSLKREKEGKAE